MRGAPTLSVERLSVYKGGKKLVDAVSLTVERGQFIAIVGPNGAGKSTLLRAIAGHRPTAGKVLLQGVSLYDSPNQVLPHIGLLPTENVLHESLQLRSALKFVGRLRGLPSGKSLEERIDNLLQEFDIAGISKQLIGSLSSGERKRANICAELLTEPRLLLLDEPTSNLDPSAERSLMDKLRKRATLHGQSIIVVSHTVNSLDRCDRVIFMANSRIVANERPGRILDALQVSGGSEYERWADAFDRYKTGVRPLSPIESLRQWFRSVKSRRKSVSTPAPSSRTPQSRSRGRFASLQSQLSVWRQFLLLLVRYWITLWNDGWSIPFTRFIVPLRLLFLTPAIGLVAGILLWFVLQSESFIPSDILFGNRYQVSLDISDVRQATFLLSLVAALMGLTGSFREIATETTIYRHERLKGLHPAAYLLSKFILVGLLYGVIAPIAMLMILTTFQPLPADGVFISSVTGLYITVILTALATVGLGLAISAIGSSSEYATLLMSIAVIAHALLSGLVSNDQWKRVIDALSVGVASRWAMEGLSTLVGVYCWAQPQFRDYYSVGHLAAVWLILVVYLFAALGLAYMALRWKDSWCRWIRRIVNVSYGFYLYTAIALAIAVWGYFLYSTSYDFYDRRTDRDIRVEDWTGVPYPQRMIGQLSEARCPEVAPLVAETSETETMLTFLPTPDDEIMSPTDTPEAKGEPSSTVVAPGIALATSSPVPDVTDAIEGWLPDTPIADATPVEEPNSIDTLLLTPAPTDNSSQTPSPTPALAAPTTPTSPPDTPMQVETPATATPTAMSTWTPEPTTTPTPSPTSTATPTTPPQILPLPQGFLPSPTELRYGPGPKHAAMAALSAGDRFTLLGRATAGPAQWYRVHVQDAQEMDRCGWIPADHPDLQELMKHTGDLPAPPDCSISVANSADDFEDVVPADGQLGTWQSAVNGDAVFVVDLFRSVAGERSNPLTFRIHVNGVQQVSFEVPSSRGSFLMRGRVFDAALHSEDQVKLTLTPVESPTLRDLRVFASVYAVPRDCEFEH